MTSHPALHAEVPVPRNFADAAATFRCPVVGAVGGRRCVELYRDGERRRTGCTGCAAGKARARLLADRTVQVVEVTAPDSRVAELVAEVETLTATVRDLADRLARAEVEVETVRNLATRTRSQAASVRVANVGFTFTGMALAPVQEWCRQHNWSLSHLARCAIREAAAREGVDLPLYASGVCKGFGETAPAKYSGLAVPESWVPYLTQKRAGRALSGFIRSAITAYMEAHP